MNKQEQINIIVEICNYVLLSGRNSYSDYQLPDLSTEEWKELLTCATVHGMLPTVTQVFEGRQIEDKTLRRAVMAKVVTAQGNSKRYQQRVMTMCELADMFNEDGISVMFFKGASLAQLYPNPQWRVFSDIDFYLFGKCADGNRVMARHGIRSRMYYHHNTEATLHGILLENHYDFVERLNHRLNLVLDDELKKMANEEGKSIRASFLESRGNNAYVMTPTMNAIFLMRHMSAHFVSESIPLRMLYDWILFLNHHGKDIDWKRVCGLYEKSGMTEFVGIVMELIRQHYHIEFPDVPIAFVANNHTEKVWESIVFPPGINPHKQYSISFFVYETKTFFGNRWKHQIVYPGESYFLLSLHYAWSVIKKKLGLLKMKEG